MIKLERIIAGFFSQADEAKLKVAEMSGEDIDNKTRLEVIKREEAIIATEKEQLEKEAKVMFQEYFNTKVKEKN